MKSGMLAAESILEEIWSENPQETIGLEAKSYSEKYVLSLFFLFKTIIWM